MRLAGRGNVRAFELLYERHANASFALARRVVPDQCLAEEAAQEAFVAMWRGLATYRAECGSVRTWMLGITRHRAIDALRRTAAYERRCVEAAGLEPRIPPTGADGEIERLEDAREITTVLEAMPAGQRRAIELAYFGGLTQTEIAANMSLPLGTVKRRMRLGLEKLRHALGDPQGQRVV